MTAEHGVRITINASNRFSGAFLLLVNKGPKMPNEEFDEREQALHYAARLKGLSLVRTGNTFALAQVTGATLDEIAAFLATDGNPEVENRRVEQQRRADLRAMLKAEHALILEFEEEKRRAGERSPNHETTEAALAEIRCRIAEIQEAQQTEASNVAQQDRNGSEIVHWCGQRDSNSCPPDS
jgi:hypothetical protein